MYEKFKELDGSHPWRNVSPDGYIDYRARYRPQGRVLFFNFPLAKEMGLIPQDDPHSSSMNLEQVILDTFRCASSTNTIWSAVRSFHRRASGRNRSWPRGISKHSIATQARLPATAAASGTVI